MFNLHINLDHCNPRRKPIFVFLPTHLCLHYYIYLLVSFSVWYFPYSCTLTLNCSMGKKTWSATQQARDQVVIYFFAMQMLWPLMMIACEILVC
jgi:hypothetical protein